MGKSKWLFAILSLVLITSIALTACGGGETSGQKIDQDQTEGTAGEATGEEDQLAEEQVLYMASDQEPPNLDTAVASDGISFTIHVNVMEGLMTWNEKNEPVPGVAKEEPQVSEDGLTYTFHLREDAKWSDDSPVTAQDFEYAWKRALAPETGSQYAFIMFDVKNAEAFNKDEVKADDVGVKALDAQTLEVKLEHPAPYFLSKMVIPTFFPQKQAFVEEMGEKYAKEEEALLYNGPFKLTNWNHESGWEYVKNETYWDADNVKLDKVVWNVVKDISTGVNLYDSGDLDVALLDGEFAAQFDDRDDYVTHMGASTQYLMMNQENDFFKNEKIRRAVAGAIDRDSLVDVILNNGSLPATSFVPPALSGPEGPGGQPFREYAGDMKSVKDIEEAKQLFQEGLQELGINQPPVVEYLTFDSDSDRKVAEYIQDQLQENLGLKLEINQQTVSSALDLMQDGDYELASTSWGATYDDPYYFLEMWLTDGPYNNAGWSNEEYDELIGFASISGDNAKRMEKMKRAEEILIEESPIAPLYFRGFAYLWRTNVEGLLRPPSGPQFYAKHAYITEEK